jgi:hypothetical protein
MQVAVDDSHNKVIWPHLQRADNQFWVLFYKQESRHHVIVAEASRVIQEAYVTDGGYPEDLLTVFTSPDAATLYIAALGKEIGAEHNDSLRVVSMTKARFLKFLSDLDKDYVRRQNAFLRVDVCELRDRELHREILFSRQIPKH